MLNVFIYENKSIYSHVETFNLNIIIMKNVFKLRMLAVVAVASFTLSSSAFAQLPTDNENVYVSLELQGVLDLTLVTDPNLDFIFSTIPQYVNGITKTNATELRVESTVAWDLTVNAETTEWENFEAYSQAGTTVIPSSIIGVRAIDAAGNSLIDGNGTANVYTALSGTDELAIIGDASGTVDATDVPGAPGTYLTSPSTHQFRVDYRLSPGLSNYTAGYYGINLVYTLAEDL